MPRWDTAQDAAVGHMVSDRIILRPVCDRDSGALDTLAGEPDVCRQLFSGRRTDHEQIDGLIAKIDCLFKGFATGAWAIRRLGSPELIRITALWPLQSEQSSSRIELGVALSSRYVGRGFAAESFALLIGYAREQLGWSLLHSSADFHNTEANRVLWRLGFVEVLVMRGPAGPLRIFSLEL